jgi:CheY-like chemotaxis protein
MVVLEHLGFALNQAAGGRTGPPEPSACYRCMPLIAKAVLPQTPTQRTLVTCSSGHLPVEKDSNVPMPTKLRALVLSQDRAAVVPLETVFGISGINPEIYREEVAAAKALSQNHFDGIILDCDHEAGAKLFEQVRKGRSNKLSPLFMLTSNMETVGQSRQDGANLVLHKPLTVLRITPHLKIALLLMSREHLRYKRYPIDRPSLITLQDGRTFQARTINVSRDGLALTVSEPPTFHKHLHVRFDLPTKEPTTISVNAEAVWSDRHGRVGLQFRHMPSSSYQRLLQGLAELHHRSVPDLVRYCN